MPKLFQRKILPGRENRTVVALWSIAVSAMAVVVFWSLAVTRVTGQATQAGDPAAWRPIWDKMMPVFTHPRCLNCHGGTNPYSGVNHNNGLAVDPENGHLPDSGCTECHSAQVGNRKPWIPTASDFAPSFVKGDAAEPPIPKEAVEICKGILARVADSSDPSPGHIINHVQKDPLIGLAFAGRRANAIPDSERADPPPMKRPVFVDLVRHWVTDAAMACDLNGTISITETLSGSRTLTQTPAGGAAVTMSQEESGTRTVTVDVQHGKATVKAEGSGKAQTVQRTDVGGCVVTITNDNAATSSGEGEGQLSLKIAPGGRGLTINLTGPEETGSQQIGGSRMQSNCSEGGDVSTTPQDVPVTGAYPYLIEVQLPQPPTGVINELAGTATQTYKWSMSPPLTGTFPWLLYGLTLNPEPNAQGQPPTVTVKTDWNLKLY